MSLEQKLRNACARAENFREDVKVKHPYIYMACKFIIKQGIHYGVDALGTLVGDPLLFEEIEDIYFVAKATAVISYKLYHYLKSMQHLHRQSIEWMDHHEKRNDVYEGSEGSYGDNENNRDMEYRNYRDYDRDVSGSACHGCVIS